MEIERRFFAGNVELRKKDDGDQTILDGIASPFGKESEDMGFREIMKRGAFKDALVDSDVVALFNHDSNFVLGRESNNTLRLREGRQGLKAEIEPPMEGTIHDLAVAPVERGDIRGMSIGFIVAEGGDEITKRQNGSILRTIHKVERLIDVSVVTFPAYPDTSVAQRSIQAFEDKEVEEQNDLDEAEKADIEIDQSARGRKLSLKEKGA